MDNKYIGNPIIENLTPMEIVEWECDNLEYTNPVYMMTWNPKPNFYEYNKLGKNLLKRQWVTMLIVLTKINRCSSCYCIVPEISDEGKLHCHGWFRLDDKTKWLLSVKKFFQNNGFLKINKLYTPIENIDYYYKEIDVTKEILNEVFCVLTSFTADEIISKLKTYMERTYINVDHSNKTRYAIDMSQWALDQ